MKPLSQDTDPREDVIRAYGFDPKAGKASGKWLVC